MLENSEGTKFQRFLVKLLGNLPAKQQAMGMQRLKVYHVSYNHLILMLMCSKISELSSDCKDVREKVVDSYIIENVFRKSG